MLIKISHDAYINPKSVDAVLKTPPNDYGTGDVVIYTRGGEKFYYSGTFEECIEKLKEAENEQDS